MDLIWSLITGLVRAGQASDKPVSFPLYLSLFPSPSLSLSLLRAAQALDKQQSKSQSMKIGMKQLDPMVGEPFRF